MHLQRTMVKPNSRRVPHRSSNQESHSAYASRELAVNVPRMLRNSSLGMAPDRRGTDRTVGVSPVIATLEQMLTPFSSREIVASVHLDKAYEPVAQPGPACYEAHENDASTIGRRVRSDSACEFERTLEPSQGAESDALAERVTSAACSAGRPMILKLEPGYCQTNHGFTPGSDFQTVSCGPLYCPKGAQVSPQNAPDQHR